MNDFAAKLVAVIHFVGEKRTHRWRERQGFGSRCDIGTLACGQMQDDRLAKGSLSVWSFVVRPARERPIA